MAGVFTKNTLITLFSRIVAFSAGLLVSIIIARNLGPEGRGVYSLTILLPGLLLIFFDFGITPASVYYLGKKKYPLSQVFGNNILLSVFFSSLAMASGVLVVFLLGKYFFSGVPTNYLLLSLLSLPINIFFYFVLVILLGMQKIKEYNLASIFSAISLLILTTTSVAIFKFGVLGAISAFILSAFAPAIFLFVVVKNLTKEIFLRPNKNYLNDVLSFGIKFHISNIFAFLHSQVSLLLISFYINPVAVGFFSIANGLTTQFQPLTQATSTVLFPKVVAEEDEQQKKRFTALICRNTMFITLIGILVLFFLARWVIVFLYSKEFLNSVLSFRILLPVIVAFTGSQILAADLIGRGKPMLNTYVNGGALLLNIILCVVWIPKFGIEGAAWALTISHIVLFVSKLIIYLGISGNKVKDVVIFSRSDLQYYKNFINPYYRLLKNTFFKRG